MPPKLVIKSPKATSPAKIKGQTQSKIIATTHEITVDAIATNLLPLKNAKKSGSLIHPSPLKQVAPIKPAKIPINGFAILLNAIASTSLISIILLAESRLKTVVKINHDTSAATPAVPSFFFAIPTPTPMANKIPILLIKAPPAVVKNNPTR